MHKKNKFWQNQYTIPILVAFLIPSFVWGVTTIGESIVTGGQLTVSGTATSTIAGDVNFDSGTVYVDSINNRLGVASSSPNFTLDVGGSVNIPLTGSYRQNGATILKINQYPSYATYIGQNAGNSVLNGDGLYNIAIGYNALSAAQTGDKNVVIGNDAAAANVAASGMVAIGYESLKSNTASNGDIAIGYRALRNAVTSSGNIVMGNDVMYNSASGASDNITIGNSALYGGTDSDYNVVLGSRSLYYTTFGNANIVLGYETGHYNTNGDNNILLGYQAGKGQYNNPTSNNVFIGYRSGYTSAVGGNNIFIGHQAGDILNFVGSNNILIGYDIDATSTTMTRGMSIGNLIYGVGLDGTGTTKSSGKIGIGSSAPESRLQVTGGGLCVGSDANCNSDNNTEGTVYAATTAMTTYDLAENYPTKDHTLAAGDVVALDTTQDGPYVKRAESGDVIIGAISAEPGALLGGFNGVQYAHEKQVPVALSGRIDVKVSTENGNIKSGDYLELSSTPGVAAKATGKGKVIGIALESYSGEGVGEVLVFVELRETREIEALKNEIAELRALVESLR